MPRRNRKAGTPRPDADQLATDLDQLAAMPQSSTPPRPAAPGPRPVAPAYIPSEEVAGIPSGEVAGRMSEVDERDIVYFENPSMWELYVNMDDWQEANNRRLLSITVQRDNGKYCCIALPESMYDQEYDENEQEYNEVEWEYDVDSLSEGDTSRFAAAISGNLQKRAASNWELVSTAPYYAYDILYIFLFWRRSRSLERL